MRSLRFPGFARTPAGAIGLFLLGALLLIAVLGPILAPHSAYQPVGAPGLPPGPGHLLGTDFLGRDVLSRVMHGGLSIIALGAAATGVAYLIGLTVGLVAGYSRSILDPLLMRAVDVLLALPGLLLVLVLISGAGSSVYVLLFGVVLMQLPGIARIMRTATLEASTRGYVEAAILRGERTTSILRRDITPTILPVLLADFGIRFGVSIIVIASVNYLGVGLKPPAADWALMMSENRSLITLNPWAVVAPGVLLALLTVSVNMISDAYVRSLRDAGTPVVLRVLRQRRSTLSSTEP